MDHLRFAAKVITGSGRGKNLKVPTLNLDIADVPVDLPEGIYACFVEIDGKRFRGAMHYGPRPVFGDSTACEVHLIDTVLDAAPEVIGIEIIERLRDVQNFPSQEKLVEQMQRDIEQCRAILGSR